MAKMIDDKPSFHGEAKTWESFQKLLPMETIVYNNREINGREFDFCILWEGMGIFVVEVKGWLADKVTVLGVDNILVDGYGFCTGNGFWARRTGCSAGACNAKSKGWV